MAFQFQMQLAEEGNPLHIPETGLGLRVTLPSSTSGDARISVSLPKRNGKARSKSMKRSNRRSTAH